MPPSGAIPQDVAVKGLRLGSLCDYMRHRWLSLSRDGHERGRKVIEPLAESNRTQLDDVKNINILVSSDAFMVVPYQKRFLRNHELSSTIVPIAQPHMHGATEVGKAVPHR